MPKALKIVAILAATVAVVTGVSLFSIYEASQQVPEFYREAVSLHPEDQQPARDEFMAHAAALASDLHRGGPWQTLFTTDQINAWLALELATNYPELLPEDLCDPRISISDKEATIACRYRNGEMSAVLSLTVDVHLQEPNVLAVRIRKARAGALPVPLAQVLDGISHAARELNLRLEWRKTHGDPVALISFPAPREGHSESLHLRAIELRDGELFASGTIGPGDDATANKAAAAQPVVGAAEKDTRQK